MTVPLIPLMELKQMTPVKLVLNAENWQMRFQSEMALTERVDVGDGFFLLLLLLPVLLAWLLCCGYAFR